MEQLHVMVSKGMKAWLREKSGERDISMSAMVKWILAEFRAKNED